jgi:hypothetical protein
MPNMKTVGQNNLKLLGGQAFKSQGPCDLDLWPSDLKINRGHPSYWADKEKPTDAQGDVRTDKLILVYPPYNFLVRGYKNA